MYELIPPELKQLRNWVCWKAVPDKRSHSGISKQPINPKTRGLAKSNDSSTWADFDTACRVSADFAGIGFMFQDSGFFGVDLDDCKNEVNEYLDGDKSGFIGEFAESLKSYAELSQSGNGIHIICKGKLPDGGRRRGKIEMYDSGRFFVMTGKPINDYTDCVDCTESIKQLHGKYLGNPEPQYEDFGNEIMALPLTDINEIIRKASNAKNGDKFSALYAGNISDYPSQSEADIAFCNMLAFWCAGDISLMDAIYRQSGLMRDKWDRKQSGSTYGMLTLTKAASSCKDSYSANTEEGFKVHIGGGDKPPAPAKMHTFDDTGNAQRLFDNFGDILRYNYVDKKWMYYDGKKWNIDNIGYSRSVADAAVMILEKERPLYEKESDDSLMKAYNAHLKRSRSFSGKTNMLNEAQHYNPIDPDTLDANPDIIGVQNGILNLETMELSPHSIESYITRIAESDYNKDASTPERWISFLDEIFGGDKELIRYVQKCVGYSITGRIDEQCAFFLYGTGCNGKSTFLDIIRNLSGGYALNIQPQSIMVSTKQSNSANSDIARLKGARFVTTVEPNEGARLDEGLIKQLTGGDNVTARKLYGDEFEFKPAFKLWMATNHKPVIRGTDPGIWRRIHLIPFEIQIPENRRDKHLLFKLSQESEGIFKWMIDGVRLWREEGLSMPGAVLNAVKEYRNEMDVVSQFFEDRCIIDKNSQEKASSLYNAYCAWADKTNEYKMKISKFGIEISKRPEIKKVRKGDGFYYAGIRLDGTFTADF